MNESLQGTSDKIRDFQRKLYLKAKQEIEFKFYVLYDKVRRLDFLTEAYRQTKRNKGAPGVDGKTFEDIEKYGVEKYLKEIQSELENLTYTPSAVLRVYIPKPNGKERPLGIPTIKDRIVQTSCKMVIEPIFEADFEDTSYGFRPNRSAKDAIRRIKENLQKGKVTVFDADLRNFFDTIPHDKLIKCIAKRITDSNVIHLIKMWLKSPIVENNKISGGKKNRVGTPQGGVISPLLANIYLHYFDKIINRVGGVFQKCGITIVRYADDFILMGQNFGEGVMRRVGEILKHFELELNTEKSRIINALRTRFNFLGFTFRYDKDLYGRSKNYLNIFPRKEASKKFREKIKTVLSSYKNYRPTELVKKLNPIIRGWANYFKVEGTYPKVEFRKNWWYVVNSLYKYYGRKSQRKSKLYKKSKVVEVLQSRYELLDFNKIIVRSPARA